MKLTDFSVRFYFDVIVLAAAENDFVFSLLDY